MKTLVLATAALLAVTASSAASGADLDSTARPGPASCPAARFQGLYAGVNAGGIAWTANRTDQDAFLGLPALTAAPATYVQHKGGAEIGGQIGYSWTHCNTLFGIEVDGGWTSPSVTTDIFPGGIFVPFAAGGPLFAGSTFNISSRVNGLITAQTRSGIAMENLLLYLTGGVAAAHFQTTWTVAMRTPLVAALLGPPVPFGAVADFSEWQLGWVVGFGTEYAWTDRISITSDTLYADFPDRQRHASIALLPALGSGPAGTFRFMHSDAMWISRIGVNVKLDPARF
jgi:outer membrane immunogenic protein